MITASAAVPESVVRMLSADECRPEVQELHALWQGMRGGRSMPARRDFDPAEARSLLPHLMLIDVLPDAPRRRRFRVRLHGTAQVEYQGVDWTGSHPHDKTDEASADRFCDIGDHIVSRREVWMSTGDLYWMSNKPYSRFETIMLPLSDDDETVNMILGLTIFF